MKEKEELTISCFKFRRVKLFKIPFGSIIFYWKIYTLFVKITIKKFRIMHTIQWEIRTTKEEFLRKLRVKQQRLRNDRIQYIESISFLWWFNETMRQWDRENEHGGWPTKCLSPCTHLILFNLTGWNDIHEELRSIDGVKRDTLTCQDKFYIPHSMLNY